MWLGTKTSRLYALFQMVVRVNATVTFTWVKNEKVVTINGIDLNWHVFLSMRITGMTQEEGEECECKDERHCVVVDTKKLSMAVMAMTEDTAAIRVTCSCMEIRTPSGRFKFGRPLDADDRQPMEMRTSLLKRTFIAQLTDSQRRQMARNLEGFQDSQGMVQIKFTGERLVVKNSDNYLGIEAKCSLGQYGEGADAYEGAFINDWVKRCVGLKAPVPVCLSVFLPIEVGEGAQRRSPMEVQYIETDFSIRVLLTEGESFSRPNVAAQRRKRKLEYEVEKEIADYENKMKTKSNKN